MFLLITDRKQVFETDAETPFFFQPTNLRTRWEKVLQRDGTLELPLGTATAVLQQVTWGMQNQCLHILLRHWRLELETLWTSTSLAGYRPYQQPSRGNQQTLLSLHARRGTLGVGSRHCRWRRSNSFPDCLLKLSVAGSRSSGTKHASHSYRKGQGRHATTDDL